MEARILQASLLFNQLIEDVSNAIDEDWVAQEGQMRDGGRIDLYRLGNELWLDHLRFTHGEVQRLVVVLDLPQEIHCSDSRNREDCVTALCMLLCRLCDTSRLIDVEMQFGWERSRFSRITRATVSCIWARWKHVLRFDPKRLTPDKLVQFGAAIEKKGAPLDTVVGFIDGTLRKIARPVRNQRIVYNGWKRIHCLKYHAIVTPDGILAHVFGPVEGGRHDETVFQQSGVKEILDKHFWTPDGRPLFIYGDPAYGVSGHVLSPYKGVNLTPEQSLFNTKMSRCWEAVEWIFKEVPQQFQFLDYSRNQKVLLSPCGLFYLVAVLLVNAHTILHHPQIPYYFQCAPPTVEEYFTGGPIDDAELDEWCLQSPWVEQDVPEDEDNDEVNS